MTASDDVMLLVLSVADGHHTEAEALDALRAAGRTPDAEALADAVMLTQAHAALLDKSLSPYDFLGCEPSIGLNAWETACNECSAGIAWAISYLSRPAKVGAR